MGTNDSRRRSVLRSKNTLMALMTMLFVTFGLFLFCLKYLLRYVTSKTYEFYEIRLKNKFDHAVQIDRYDKCSGQTPQMIPYIFR